MLLWDLVCISDDSVYRVCARLKWTRQPTRMADSESLGWPTRMADSDGRLGSWLGWILNRSDLHAFDKLGYVARLKVKPFGDGLALQKIMRMVKMTGHH